MMALEIYEEQKAVKILEEKDYIILSPWSYWGTIKEEKDENKKNMIMDFIRKAGERKTL
jgi:hypothetical protein